MESVERLVSGGQTGVDRAALDFAIDTGLEHGGWCPEGGLAEDGPIPAGYRLRELPAGDYAARTRQNVVDSDATLVLSLGPLTGGTRLTVELAGMLDRPCKVVLLDETAHGEQLLRVRDWLRHHRVRVLNVAGPRQSLRPGIHRLAYRFLAALWQSSSSTTADRREP